MPKTAPKANPAPQGPNLIQRWTPFNTKPSLLELAKSKVLPPSKAQQILNSLQKLKEKPTTPTVIIYDASQQDTMKELQESIEKLSQKDKAKLGKIKYIPIEVYKKTDGGFSTAISDEELKTKMSEIATELGKGSTVLSLCNNGTPKDQHIALNTEINQEAPTQQEISDQADKIQNYIRFMSIAINNQPNLSTDIDKKEEEEFKFLKEAYQKAKKPSTSRLDDISKSDSWEPKGVNVANEVMEEFSKEDWQNFFKELGPEQKEGLYLSDSDNKEHKATIYDKPATEEENRTALVHITPQGLICPTVDEAQKPAQDRAIANSIAFMASKASKQPLEIEIKGFTEKDFAPILDNLQKNNVNVKIHIDEKYLSSLDKIEQQKLTQAVQAFNERNEEKIDPAAKVAKLSTPAKAKAPEPPHEPERQHNPPRMD